MGKKINLFFVIILLMAALFVINQGRQEQQAGNGRSSDSSAATPGRLVVAQAYPVQCLDPAQAEDIGSLRVITNVYEGLVQFAPGTAVVEPCLAESWKVSEDCRTWTFNLRRNVRFHDGTPLDARAVELSVKRQLAGKNGVTSYADFVYGPVKNIEVVDRYTVRFILKYPYAPFINNLAAPMAAPVVGPVANSEAEGGIVVPAGTGPFVPISAADGGVLLRANEDYWQNRSGVNEVLFMHVSDCRQRTLMLVDGQAHISLDLDFDNATSLRFRGLPVYRTTGLDICYLGFYTDRKPFDRAAVRAAVANALDREEIFKRLGLQQVEPAAGHLPPGVPGYVAGGANSDLSEAARLLREAGYEEGLTFTLITFTDGRPYAPSGGMELAEAVSGAASRAGIKINVRAYPWERFKQALQSREGDAFLYGWISDNGDADNFLYTLLAPDQVEKGQNLTRYCNSELGTLLSSGRNTTNGDIRRELYSRAQEVLSRDVPWVVLGHSLHHAGTAPGVNGFVLNPTGWHALGGVTYEN